MDTARSGPLKGLRVVELIGRLASYHVPARARS